MTYMDVNLTYIKSISHCNCYTRLDLFVSTSIVYFSSDSQELSPLLSHYSLISFLFYDIVEEFEDIKGIIRIHKSKKNRQHNGTKKYKRTNNDQQNIHIKLKIE